MSTGLRTRQAISRFFLLVSVSCALCDVAAFAMDDPDTTVRKYLETNLVAALVGYHTTREVAHGIRIPCFSASISDGETNTLAALMYVIAPTNYSGKYFLVGGPDLFPPSSGKTSNYLRPNEFYSFALPADIDSNHDVRRWLFDIPPKLSGISVHNLLYLRFFVTTTELNEQMKRLEDREEETSLKKKKLEQKNISSSPQQASRWHRGQIKVLEAELSRIEYWKANALRQRPLVDAQRKVLCETIPMGLGPGDAERPQ